MMFDLKGRTAVVTGASAGLGTEIAEGLARQGADLAILARRGELLEKQAEKLRAYGVRVMPVVCDVTKQQAVEQAADMIVKEYGKIDIAVNNAGGGKGAKAEEMPAENWEYTINLSLNGMYHCCKAFGKFMLDAGYGRMINISSMYGLIGNVRIPSSAYHAAKGGVVNYTRALAAEWGARGVTVNAVCPGFFLSETTERLWEKDFFVEYLDIYCPMHRGGRKGELNAAIVFLAAEESSYVNGAILPVDGGMTCI